MTCHVQYVHKLNNINLREFAAFEVMLHQPYTHTTIEKNILWCIFMYFYKKMANGKIANEKSWPKCFFFSIGMP